MYDDPAEGYARRFLDDGATWLHVVDLDGARDGAPANAELVGHLAGIARSAGARLQLGGGIRTAAVARYEAALGRPVVDLAWHEVFALVRSVAINDRQARLAAAAGLAYPGVAGDENPVLAVLSARIEEYEAGETEEGTGS